ncbi:MAG: transcription factor S [Methanomassiliicoccus sp.]|jgi:DNA-directed RNA polymerase subunit M|nr:transcription factor S [Methanomassiliicoccus sp.]
MFCPKCGGLLRAKEGCKGEFVCPNPKCEFEQSAKDLSKTAHAKTIMGKNKKEVEDCPVVDGIEGTMPKTNVPCPKCNHNEAYWYLRQTRKSDEPETTFLSCCKCGYRWRKY